MTTPHRARAGSFLTPLLAALLVQLAVVGEALGAEINGFRADALFIDKLINDNYAYLDRFEGERAPISTKLRAEAEQVADKRSLLRYAERALLLLADHHAITGSSLADSWALVPSYSDLWIEKRGNDFVIDAVREGSLAGRAGIVAGDRLVAIDGVRTPGAVASFWGDLGLRVTDERAAFAARILAAGKRDRPRRLTVQKAGAKPRAFEIASLYAAPHLKRPPLSVVRSEADLRIRFNDSLGDSATVAAFDAAMRQAAPKQRIVIDLTDTPSGGNTSVARAILGWFVTRPTAYQVHNLPREKRQTGIERQGIEQVLPRQGKYHAVPVSVRVGRWTGSMGEGLAIGFDAIGAVVSGDRMAGLRGSVEDYRLEHSGLVLKLPTERLMAVDGTPREKFVPRRR